LTQLGVTNTIRYRTPFEREADPQGVPIFPYGIYEKGDHFFTFGARYDLMGQAPALVEAGGYIIVKPVSIATAGFDIDVFKIADGWHRVNGEIEWQSRLSVLDRELDYAVPKATITVLAGATAYQVYALSDQNLTGVTNALDLNFPLPMSLGFKISPINGPHTFAVHWLPVARGRRAI